MVSLFKGILTFVGYLMPKQPGRRTPVILFNLLLGSDSRVYFLIVKLNNYIEKCYILWLIDL